MAETIRAAFAAGRFDFTEHAAEEYPDDKYGPTRLLLGFTEGGRPLHIQVADSPSPTVRIITLYEPNPAEWEDYQRRR